MEHFMAYNGDGWEGTCFISQPEEIEEAMINVTVRTLGRDAERALYGAQFLLALFAEKRMAYIRVHPVVNIDRNFDTKETIYHGFVRFSFITTPGEWHYPPENQPVVGLGPALEATQKNDAT